jgi:hypothetical protein
VQVTPYEKPDLSSKPRHVVAFLGGFGGVLARFSSEAYNEEKQKKAIVVTKR